MARKQTLKSLLGGNDSRVEVDLNLDDQTFRAPTVSAGNYSVAAPVYSKTNSLTQISNALERYSGPILRGYADIKEKQGVAMADATELLTTEQLKLLNDGDPSGLVTSINETKDKLDEAQRKKLIKFAENPNNYERAYRRVGERAFNAFKTDVLTNMPEYAEDENFSMETKKDELIEEYGLGGLGRVEFEKLFNSFDARTQSQLGQLRNDHLEKESILESVSIYSEMLLDDTTALEGQEGLNETVNQHPYETQKSIFKGVVREMAVENPKRARDLITDYEEGDYQLGNGEMDGEFRDSLIDIVTNQTERAAEFVELQLGESMRIFLGKGQAGEEIGELEIPYGSGEGDFISFTPDGNTVDDYQEALTTALTRTEDNPLDGMPETVRYSLLAQAAKLKEDELGKEKNERSMYLRAPMTEITSALKTEIFGENVNGLSQEEITSEGIRHYGELSDIVKKISSDPQYKTPVEKESAIMLAVGEYKDKVIEGAVKAKDQKEEVARVSNFETTAGVDERLNNTVLRRFGSGLEILNTKIDDGDVSAETPIPDNTQLNESAIEQEKLIREGVKEIYDNPELTDEEKEAGLSLDNRSALMDFRGKEAQDYVSTRLAELEEDISYDGIIGNLAENKQAVKDKESAEKAEEAVAATETVEEKRNVVIGEGTAGFAATKIGTRVEADPQWVKGNVIKNDIEDITYEKDLNYFGPDALTFKIGASQAGQLRMEIRMVNDPEINSLHKLDRHFAIQHQNGERLSGAKKRFNLGPDKEMVTSRETKLGEESLEDFFTNELVIRTVRDGKAGLTLSELESGNVEGVAFNPLEVDKSVNPILPFGLINKVITNQELTVQEEATIRDYADLLYDTSEIGEQELDSVIVQNMVELQVNAYNELGFRFGK